MTTQTFLGTTFPRLWKPLFEEPIATNPGHHLRAALRVPLRAPHR
jgi:hypothetical protein